MGAFSAALQASGKGIVGITHGLDYAVFNPATDSALPSRYDAEDASHKGICKTAVLRELELALDLERPLILVEGPVTPESGGETLVAALSPLTKTEAAIVVVGEIAPEYSKKVRALASRRRDDVALVEKADAATLRRLFAAADIAVLSPRPAPAAQSQMVAQRYGALPVGRAVGCVVDTVVDCDAKLETGTGFLYDEESAEALVGAVARALAAHASPSWARLRRRVMRLDVGWDRPARRYLQVYRQVLATGR
jgi:starch synthase